MKAHQNTCYIKWEKNSRRKKKQINRNGLIESKKINDERRNKMFSELTTKSHLHDTTIGNLFTLRSSLLCPPPPLSLSLLRYFQDYFALNATQIEINIKTHSAKSLVMLYAVFFFINLFHFLSAVFIFLLCCRRFRECRTFDGLSHNLNSNSL